MKANRRTALCSLTKIVRSESGFLLIVSLGLLATLTLVGTVAFMTASTDLMIGANFKSSKEASVAAAGGLEHGREVLRALNASSANVYLLSEELSGRVGSNATLDGYTTGSDDVPVVAASLGKFTYVVYLTNDAADGATNQVDSNGRAYLTSVATGPRNALAIVEGDVARNGGISAPAVFYTKGDAYLDGDTGEPDVHLTVDGNDACPGSSGGVAPLYVKTPKTTTLLNDPVLGGSPSTPQSGTQDIDIDAMISSLKINPTIITDAINGTNYGSPSNPAVVYADTSCCKKLNKGLDITSSTGYGVLLVKGDLKLHGGFTWHGLVIVTGEVRVGGGGGNINIRGSVIAGNDLKINGSIDAAYDSCALNNYVPPKTFQLVNWKKR